MPLWDDEKESIWMLPGYFDGISQAGAIPIMLPFTKDEQETDQLFDMCDGFLFTGGHDVSPEIYNEEPMGSIVVSCRKRDEITSGKPVIGAKLVILDKDGKEVESWVTEEKPHYIEKLPVGEYTLREITAPDGYLRAEDVKFTVKETGEIQKVAMKDDYTKVEISKQDI